VGVFGRFLLKRPGFLVFSAVLPNALARYAKLADILHVAGYPGTLGRAFQGGLREL
jgi:V8-like Glu-specific endopeptidase